MNLRLVGRTMMLACSTIAIALVIPVLVVKLLQPDGMHHIALPLAILVLSTLSLASGFVTKRVGAH
jgi:hypothetical protein